MMNNNKNKKKSKAKMGIQQKLLLARVNKRIDRVVSQYLKVLQTTDVDTTSCDEYSKFVTDIQRARLASSSDESDGGGVYNDESVILFAKQLCLPVEECKFLERMGTRLVLASISKESGDTLLAYLKGLHDMCHEYTNKYHCTESSIKKAMNICDDVLNGVRQDDRSMLSTIFSGVLEKLRGCSSPDSVVDEILALMPSSVVRDLQSTCGLSRDELRSEVLRIHRCLSRKDTSTKLRKHLHAVMNIFSRILNQGKAKPIFTKFTSILSILIRGRQVGVVSTTTTATATPPSCGDDIEPPQPPPPFPAAECSMAENEDTKHKNKRVIKMKTRSKPKPKLKPRPRRVKANTTTTTTELEIDTAAEEAAVSSSSTDVVSTSSTDDNNTNLVQSQEGETYTTDEEKKTDDDVDDNNNE